MKISKIIPSSLLLALLFIPMSYALAVQARISVTSIQNKSDEVVEIRTGADGAFSVNGFNGVIMNPGDTIEGPSFVANIEVQSRGWLPKKTVGSAILMITKAENGRTVPVCRHNMKFAWEPKMKLSSSPNDILDPYIKLAIDDNGTRNCSSKINFFPEPSSSTHPGYPIWKYDANIIFSTPVNITYDVIVK